MKKLMFIMLIMIAIISFIKGESGSKEKIKNPQQTLQPRGTYYKGMDYQEVKRIWISKGYTVRRDAKEYNNYNETGEVTIIFRKNDLINCATFNFRWWTLEDWSVSDSW